MNRWLIYLNYILPISIVIVLASISRMIFTGSYGSYSSIVMLTKWVILPVFLVIINLCLYFFKIENSFFRCSIFMLLGLIAGEVIGYLIWGIASKRLLNPGGETISLMSSLFIFYIVLIAIILVIVDFIKLLLHWPK